MNIKNIFKIISYSLLGAAMVVASFFGFEKKSEDDSVRFQMPEIPQANADVPIPPYYWGDGGDGGDGGGGDA